MKAIHASIAAGILSAALATAQPRYTVIDLGALPGGSFSVANYMNDNRLIGGNGAGADGIQQSMLWAGPFRINIGTPGLNSGIFGINGNSQVSISGEMAKKDPLNENFCAWGTGLLCPAFLWQRGILTALPTLGGNNSTVGNINVKGEVVGASETGATDPACPIAITVAGTGPQYYDYEAVIWGPAAGAVRPLKPLGGDTVGMALWINDSSQAVGASGTCANTVLPPIAYGPHAVIWNADGTVHDLGNLGSTHSNMALSINNGSQVTGVSSVTDKATPNNGVHAFLWTNAAGMKDLGTLPGDVASVGCNIGDSGDVVGPSFDKDGNTRAFLWHKGVMSDLNDLAINSPLFLIWGTAVNNHGEISGFGVTAKGDIHAYVATPVSSTAQTNSIAAPLPDVPAVTLTEDVRTLVRERISSMRLPYVTRRGGK